MQILAIKKCIFICDIRVIHVEVGNFFLCIGWKVDTEYVFDLEQKRLGQDIVSVCSIA